VSPEPLGILAGGGEVPLRVARTAQAAGRPVFVVAVEGWADPAAWAGIAEPAARLRAALLAFYDYYRRAEDMLVNARRDAPELPALAALLTPFDRFVEAVREDLQKPWRARGRARARVGAAIGHALRLDTWRSLAHGEGLDDAAAAELMVALARAALVAAHAGEAGPRTEKAPV